MFSANTTQVSSGGYQISRSLRFNSADTAYLSRTPASAGNRKTWTFSTWLKRGSTSANVTLFSGGVGGFGRLNVIIENGYLISDLGGTGIYDQSTAVYRDPSAWYHFVWQFDTTQATAANRSRMYINGAEVTLTKTRTFTQNTDYEINNNVLQTIGTFSNAIGTYNFDGYQTEINFIDGQALTPSSFGETNAQTGVWQPKAFAGTYGTNGFYLNFSDNSNTTAATLGKDYSGNGNNWTPNNFSVTAGAGNDSLVDSPTSYGTDTGVGGTVRGNYCTWNPISVYGASAANGNLDATVVGSGNAGKAVANGTIAVSSGKFYWEVTPISGDGYFIGVSDPSGAVDQRAYNSANGWGYFLNGNKYTNNTGVAYGASYASNDVIGVALDMDAGTLTFYKNGTSQGTAYSSLNTGRSLTPYVGDGSGSTNQVYYANFGQRPFAYTAPSGFKALCTQNLPTPTIGATTATQAGTYFNTITWSGTGSGTSRSLTGVGFQPDWVWTKTRTTGYANQLYDSVRGAGSVKAISSNNSDSEIQNNVALYGYISAFNSDGFTGTNGTDATIPSAYYNQSGQTYVAWNWKESVTAGFDIVSYTGTGANRTVAHNLGVAPKMIFIKATNSIAVSFWQVYNSENGPTKTIYLNSSNAAATDSTSWNNTAPTSSVFTVGTNSDVNSNAISYIAYCFAEVASYSKFGSYTGNGSTDGPFLFTGFRPAYVMIKCSSNNATTWIVGDGTRNPSNVADLALFPNLSNAEGSGALFDLTANGIKLRTTSSDLNSNGYTYIFMAFASAPLKYSLAR